MTTTAALSLDQWLLHLARRRGLVARLTPWPWRLSAHAWHLDAVIRAREAKLLRQAAIRLETPPQAAKRELDRVCGEFREAVVARRLGRG